MKNKKFIWGIPIAAILGLGIYAFQISSSVPLKVKSAFIDRFPDAKKVVWGKESKMEWEAEFKLNGMDYSALFLENGTWQETEHNIKPNSIPKNVMETFEKAFSSYKMEEVEIAETANGIVYEFEAEKGEENIEISIDSRGKLLSRKESKDFEEEND